MWRLIRGKQCQIRNRPRTEGRAVSYRFRHNTQKKQKGVFAKSLCIQKVLGLTTTLTLSGCLDTTTAPKLEATLADVLSGARELILDLRDIEYISSAGLRVLLKAQKSMCGTNGAMKLRNVPEAVLEVFDITDFSEFLTIEA